MNLLEYLEFKGIEYKTRGKNVSKGWVGICCLYHNDRSYHLGISPKLATFNCWVCGERGSLLKLVQKIESCDFKRAREIAETILPLDINYSEEDYSSYPKQENLLSPFHPLSEPYYDYLRSRNFDPDLIEYYYGVVAGGHIGSYKFRLIIPIIIDNKLVSFTARAIKENMEPRYLLCPEKEAHLPRQSLIYNIDSVDKVAVIVEGPTDVFRMGNGFIALLSTAFSKNQVLKIVSLKLKRCFIMFDSGEEAYKRACGLSIQLAPFINHVEIIQLSEGDPGSLSESDARYLRRILL